MDTSLNLTIGQEYALKRFEEAVDTHIKLASFASRVLLEEMFSRRGIAEERVVAEYPELATHASYISEAYEDVMEAIPDIDKDHSFKVLRNKYRNATARLVWTAVLVAPVRLIIMLLTPFINLINR